jgi:hypothetical protein
MKFDLVPHCLKHVWYYHSHSVPHTGFQVLKVVAHNLVDNVLHITPQEKIHWGLIWKRRRPSDWSISADPFPSHLSVQVIPNMVTEMWQCMYVSQAQKQIQSFPFWWLNPDTCMTVSQIIFFIYLWTHYVVFDELHVYLCINESGQNSVLASSDFSLSSLITHMVVYGKSVMQCSLVKLIWGCLGFSVCEVNRTVG